MHIDCAYDVSVADKATDLASPVPPFGRHIRIAIRSVRATRTATIDNGSVHIVTVGNQSKKATDGFLDVVVNVLHLYLYFRKTYVEEEEKPYPQFAPCICMQAAMLACDTG